MLHVVSLPRCQPDWTKQGYYVRTQVSNKALQVMLACDKRAAVEVVEELGVMRAQSLEYDDLDSAAFIRVLQVVPESVLPCTLSVMSALKSTRSVPHTCMCSRPNPCSDATQESSLCSSQRL